MSLRAPFPWFGGKRRVASIVWERFGDTANYVEPFAGSMAVLLGRPTEPRVETVNDLDCFVANFWRSLQADPDLVAQWADWPVNEVDLHARHRWLVDRVGFRERMAADPEYYDPQVAGWWAWGISQWIGSGWCRAGGLWHRYGGHSKDRGVHGGTGKGEGALSIWMHELADRLRRVRVCCGDWSRILGPSPTTCIGTTAVFLDPPYGVEAERTARIYSEDSLTVAGQALAWCRDHGDDPKLRIALCGYEGEHDELEAMGWDVVAWATGGGYGARTERGKAQGRRERIWFSPYCLLPQEAAASQSTIEGIG